MWLARLDEQLVQAQEGTDDVPAALASMAESGQQVFAEAHGRLLQGVLDPEGADWGGVMEEGMVLTK